MNKFLRPTSKPVKPAQPAKPADRQLAQYRRLAFWRRGTLVLVP